MDPVDSKLFISHAVADGPLVESYIDLLEAGVGVEHRQIFCSSFHGQRIKPGKQFVESIRKELDGAGCVVALISEAFYASQFCICELGGVWLQTKDFLPILVPPLGFSSLTSVLQGMQALRLDHEADLDEMRDEIKERLKIKGHDTPRWNSRKTRFLRGLPEILKALPQTAPVPRAEHLKLAKSLDEYKTEYETCERQIGELNQQIDELKRVKDAAGVAEVLAKHMSFEEEFQDLVETANEALSGLPSVVQEAIYYASQRKEYQPKSDDWEDIDAAVEEGQLAEHETDGGGRMIEVDRNNAESHAALKAVERLGEWLDGAPNEFFTWYDARYKDRPELKRRPFWRRHLS